MTGAGCGRSGAICDRTAYAQGFARFATRTRADEDLAFSSRALGRSDPAGDRGAVVDQGGPEHCRHDASAAGTAGPGGRKPVWLDADPGRRLAPGCWQISVLADKRAGRQARRTLIGAPD